MIAWLVFWASLAVYNAWDDPTAFIHTGTRAGYGCVGDVAPGLAMGDC